MNDIWSEIENPGVLLQLAGAALSVAFVGVLLIRHGVFGCIVLVKLLFLGVLNWLVVIPVLGAAMQGLRSARYREFREQKDVVEIALFIALVAVVNLLLSTWLFHDSLD